MPTPEEMAALVEAAREAHDWLLQSPYKGKQGRGDRDMANKLSDALQPFRAARSAS